MKKGSMELGVNSIVVLIIAMAVLGLIIYFIYDKLSDPDIPEIPIGEPKAPSYTEPITFVTSAGIGGLVGKPKEQLSAKIAVLNPNGTYEIENAKISLECDNAKNAEISSTTATIGAGQTHTYTAILTMPTGVAQKYVCQIVANGSNAANTAPAIIQDVFVEIK